MKPAKIVKLDIENVMRIKAVHIEPDGNVVILGGKNAQGKTAVLDAISMGIGGMKLCPEVPIREGQERAEISLTLGEMEVTRKFWKGPGGELKSSLTVKNAEGQPLSPPQKTLDDLIGRLAFDPLEFARMSPADARETLRELVGLDVEQLEDELGRVFRSRTEAGQEKRAAQAVVDELPVPGEEQARTSTDAITAEMATAANRQAEFEELKGALARATQERDNCQDRLNALVEQMQLMTSAIGNMENLVREGNLLVKRAESEVGDFKIPDIEAIRERLASAMALNRGADEIRYARERYQEKVEQAETAAEKWKKLDTEHNQIFHEIKKRTEAVTYPIPNLELRTEGVYYQGVPFEQGSRAERIKVSLAMGMALNDKLRILLIRDGSVLDADSMATIADLAEQHDFQFWIEMARGYEGAAGAVIIDDGGVV